MGYVYILHFDETVSGTDAKHYIGFAKDRDHLEQRIAAHRAGTGSQFTHLAKKKGIAFKVVRTYRNADAESERLIKKIGAALLCPICNPQATYKPVGSRDREGTRVLDYRIYKGNLD